jgi:hypothetical protein
MMRGARDERDSRCLLIRLSNSLFSSLRAKRSNPSIRLQTPPSELHDALAAQASAVKTLLGGLAGDGVAEAANEAVAGGFDILVKSLLAQHELHVG